MVRTTRLAVILILMVSPQAALAQDASSGASASLSSDQADAPQTDSPPRPTLPPVIVRPERVAPREGVADVPVAPTDTPTDTLSRSYPDLKDLRFGGTSPWGENLGVLRGSGSLFDTPAAGSIVTRERILERQAPDMFRALQNEVGIMMQSTAAGQASPFMRGLTGQQVLILVDGIRLNNSIFRFGPNQYFNTIDPGMVDRIEVLRGRGSVLWGSDAIGGVINVITRGPDLQQALAQGGYQTTEFTQYYNTSNSSPYSRLNVEGWLGRTGVFGGGSYLNVRDLDTGWDDFSRQPGTNYQQYAGDIKVNYLLSEQQLLTISLQHLVQQDLPRSDRYPGYPGDRNNSNTAAKARFFDPQQRDLAYIRYQALEPLALSDALTFTASYNRQRENQTRGIPTTRFQETDVETVGLSIVSAKDMGMLGKLTMGADWYHDDVDSKYGGTASGPIIPDDAYYERIGCFLNWDVPLTNRLSAVSGVRYESIDLGATPVIDVNGAPTPIHISPHYSDWIAHGGLVYELIPEVHLVGSISEGFRAPNLDELTANNPNVLQEGRDLPSLDLMPENSVSYEVGVKTNYHRLRSQTFVYWTNLDNNIVPISAGSNEFRRANQDSFIQGVEFQGEWLLDRGWSIYGNYWYTYGKNRETVAPLSRIPPMQGIAGLRWRDPGLRGYFAIYTWLVDRQERLDPVRDLGDERIPIGGTPGFATLNIRCGKTLGCHDQHRVSLALENITDQPYLVHGSGVYGTGITARFGYSWVY